MHTSRDPFVCQVLHRRLCGAEEQVLELRGIPVLENTGRELWVRGPERHWHPYAIFQDKIEVCDWDIFGVRSFRYPGQQTLPVE